MRPKSVSPFGNWLREHRKAAGMTQKELNEASGVDIIHLSRLENGRSGVTPETVRKLAIAIGVDQREALYRAGFGRMTDYPDSEFTMLMDGLNSDQQRIILNAARAIRETMLSAPAANDKRSSAPGPIRKETAVAAA